VTGPDLVVLFGPPAVGKATVGRELAAQTGYKLFHNHMVLEPVHAVFDFGEGPFWTLVGEFRRRIFEEVARSDLSGLIFTYVWALDREEDRRELEGYLVPFGRTLAEVKFAELACPQAVRLDRNRHPDRLAAKPSKRNLVQSEGFLLRADREERLNTNGAFPWSDHFVRVDNEPLTPAEAATRIRVGLGLPLL
jgi:hypothetical protein